MNPVTQHFWPDFYDQRGIGSPKVSLSRSQFLWDLEFLNGYGCKSVTAEKKGHVLLEVIFTPHVSSSFFITKPEVEPFINWFIGKYFTNLLILPRFNFFLCACERRFETASFCLKFWLLSSRRQRNWFCRFSPNPSGLLKNKLHHV